MSLSRTVQLCAVLAVALWTASVKAQSVGIDFLERSPTESDPTWASSLSMQHAASGALALPEEQPSMAAVCDYDALFAGDSELSLARFVEEVQSRNPTIEAMVAAWRAAAQRYPQAIALDDPMFVGMIGPASFGEPNIEPAYMLEASQKLPWFGKRAARGRIAQAEASAAREDVQTTQLMLAEAAELAFFDYYLAHRQQEFNTHNMEVMRQFRQTAQSKYRANQVTERDVIQADVELIELERRQLELNRQNVVAVARINTLLRRPPQAGLPPTPAQLPVSAVTWDIEVLQQISIQQRPDVAALAARVRAEQAAVALACKEYYPDTEIVGRYDAFWQEDPLKPSVGVKVNVPIYRGRLNAAVREATARLNQRRAEYSQKVLDVRYEVQAAYAQLEQSRQALKLYSEKLLPFAEQNVNVARANYDVAKDSFLNLALAQRQLIEVREKREEALVDFYRSRAELNRATGGAVPQVNQSEDIPSPTP
jgi:outer membrane protein TolC